MKNENQQHSLWFSTIRNMTGRHGLARKLAVGAAVAGLSFGAAVPVSAAPIQSAVDADSIIGLAEGASGAEVKLVQQALIASGVRVAGGADGRFGPATASAVTSFQVREQLPTSGRIDEFTASALGLVATSTPAPAPTADGLKVGIRGEAVKAIQQMLLTIGVPVAGGADGIFGPGTKAAVSNFQRWNGLTVTGVVDSTTAARISTAAGQKSTPTPPADPVVPAAETAPASTSQFAGLKVGSSGAAVKELQQRLQATGLVLRGGADGSFGPATKSAVQAFQEANGLERTGVVTAQVAELLEGTASSSTTTAPVAVKTPTSPYAGLKIGNSGDKVKELQRALLSAGVAVPGGADGSFGNATKRALESFQKANGLSQSGVLTDAGAKVLGLGTTATTPPATDNTSGTTAKGYAVPGENSSRTRALQEQLIAWNIQVVGGADAEFGASTVAAVKKFQKVHGLTVTGTVTSETAKKLKLPPIDKITPVEASSIKLDYFPVQGRCYYGDTWGAARGGGRAHAGVDIIATEGQYLYAVADGTIAKRFHDLPGALSGNGVRLTIADGTYFTYLHMLDVAPGIKVGTKVKAGDILGFVGTTGSSATPHLHFEIHPGGGAAVNPYPYVRAIDACKDTSERFQTSYLPAG